MMIKVNKTVGIVLLMLLIVGNSSAQKKKTANQIKKIRNLVEELRVQEKVPGLGFAIVKDGQVILMEGFGLRDQEKSLPVTKETVFTIASVSKSFTAASIGVLVDDGLLKWDEPVRSYLPNFQLKDNIATENATLLDLATHRVGLPRHDLQWYNSSFTRTELLDRLKYLDLSKSFRSTWQYQNLMYTAAGFAVGQVAGTSWESVVQERLLDPLGMKSTYFSVSETQKRLNYALPYRELRDEIVPASYRNVDAIGPAGSVTSTVEDMSKWVRFHLKDTTLWSEEILSSSQMDFMHSPQIILGLPAKQPELTPPSYGLGWFVYYYKGHKVVEHGGNLEGFTSLVYLLPEDDMGLVILTNKNRSSLPKALARYTVDILLGLTEIDWNERILSKKDKEEENEKEEKQPVAGTNPSHSWENYTGKFEHNGYGEIIIEAESDTSLSYSHNGFNYKVRHFHYDVFEGVNEAYDDNKLLNFKTNLDGEIESVEIILDVSVDPIVFKKLPPNQLKDSEFLSKLVGNYKAKELTMKVEYKSENVIQITPKGQPTFELVPYRGYEYKFKEVMGYSIEFIMDKSEENVVSARLIQPNGIFKVERIAN